MSSTKQLTLCLLMFLYTTFSAGAVEKADHLLVVEKKYGPLAEYERLWMNKLVLNRKPVAQFVSLPGNSGLELAMSIHREESKDHAASVYVLTISQPSARLWDCVRTSGKRPVRDPRKITTERCDIALPASTAKAVREIWLGLLAKVRTAEEPEPVVIDSTTELLFAARNDGRVLVGQIPPDPISPTLTSVIDLTNSLIELCNVRESDRPARIQAIERRARKIFKRI